MMEMRQRLLFAALTAFASSSLATTLGPYEYEPDSGHDELVDFDLDQRSMAARLSLETEDGMNQARAIYRKGAYAAPSADLTLTVGLEAALVEGTVVTGTAQDGSVVSGELSENAAAGSRKLRVSYDAGASMGLLCSVGGNPRPLTEGCFMPLGNLTVGSAVDGTSYSYVYDPLEDNYNAWTLDGLSKRTQEVFRSDPEGSPTFVKYFQYYGEEDYATNWIEAAFDGIPTYFKNGKPDFEHFGLEGRAAAIRWGVLVLNLWIYVLDLVERAAHSCKICTTNSNCNSRQLHDLDEAVTLYTGSKHNVTQDGGYLLYSLAQIECKKFGTCEEDGQAAVHVQLFEQLQRMKQYLRTGACDLAAFDARRVRGLLTVPLIQGVLRQSYALDLHDDKQEGTQGRGAAFAAAVLPLVDACDASAATLLYADLTPGKGTGGSFEVAKFILERNYECLGVTCEDVGGLLTFEGEGYQRNAHACGPDDYYYDDTPVVEVEKGSEPLKESPQGSYYQPPSRDYVDVVEDPLALSEDATTKTSTMDKEASSNNTFILFLAIGLPVILFVPLLLFLVNRCRQMRKEKSPEEPETRPVSPKGDVV